MDGETRQAGSLGGEMPAEHAILGLLRLQDGSSHGYDLARHFADGQPLAVVLRLEPGMLYHHLKKLRRAGWATASTEPQPSRPARQMHQITDAGRSELDRWLREPVEHTREIRLEFLVKLYFARRLDRALAERLVAEQLETFRRHERSLLSQARGEAFEALPGDEREFVSLVVQLRLAQTRSAIAWLEDAGA